MDKNVILTGGSGFVGGNLSVYLKGLGFTCFNLVRDSIINNSYDLVGVHYLNNSSVFIHLAGNNHHVKNNIKDHEYFEVNTELTIKLFDQFLESTCETFIYMSSVKAVADEVEGFLKEDFVPNPITAYGKSKLAAEQYIVSKEIPSNKRVYILRPCMIHGPNNKGNLNLLYNFVSKGIPYPFGKYKNKRSFVSVENLCFIVKELIENKGIQSGIYNVADDATLSTKELVQIIGEVVGKPAKILNISKGVIKIIAKLGDLLPLPVNTERVQKLTENYSVSNTKIKKAIGKELPLNARQGIEKTIQSFLS